MEGLTNVTIFLPSLEAFSQLPEPFIEMLAVEPANLLEFMLRQEGNSMRTLVVAVVHIGSLGYLVMNSVMNLVIH